MKATFREMLPLIPLCALILALLIYAAMGKKNHTFDGLFVEDLHHSEFYPKFQGCTPQGTGYWLVPSHDFGKVVSYTLDMNHLDRQNIWRVKLRGDLSRIGHFGFHGGYWRELSVSYVIDATPLNCEGAK